MSSNNGNGRVFEARPATRENVPLLIGLVGPSGSGKTFSALRLATGIQKVSGGEIFGVDTEARRMLHYADNFKFSHVQFDAPFGSDDYLAVLRYCVAQGGKTIIVDSTSHEHEGPGGLLDFQEQELTRLGGSDKVKMLAWVKPKAARRRLINGMLQLNANMIFCFRAKSVSKPVKNQGGKVEIVPQGFVPIAGDDFIYEMMVNCFLPPKSQGVPKWDALEPGEAMAMKLPEQFKGLFAAHKSLDEDIGYQLALWASGGKQAPEVIEWTSRLEKIASVGQLNAALPDLAKVPANSKQQVWRIIQAKAAALQWTWEKDRKTFTDPKAPEPAAEEPPDFTGEHPDEMAADETLDDITGLISDLQGQGVDEKTISKARRDSGIKDANARMTKIQAEGFAQRLGKLQAQNA